jgi:hypothetical protein
MTLHPRVVDGLAAFLVVVATGALVAFGWNFAEERGLIIGSLISTMNMATIWFFRVAKKADPE